MCLPYLTSSIDAWFPKACGDEQTPCCFIREICPAGTVKLGQKLCTKDGKQIQYPKYPLPSEMKRDPHM